MKKSTRRSGLKKILFEKYFIAADHLRDPAQQLARRICDRCRKTAPPSPEVLARLFSAGADIFRLNFSHGTHDDHLARFQMIRDLEEKMARPIGILADVQGPKLRVGRFGGGRRATVVGPARVAQPVEQRTRNA